MSCKDLKRVRDDLDTIGSAIGLPPRWDPREVRINLLFAVAGVAALAWALAPHPLSPLFGLTLLAIPVIEWARFATASANPVATARDFRQSVRAIWLALPLLALFVWSRHVGLPPLHYLGLAIFLLGTALFSAAVAEKQGFSFLGWAAALMAGGLLLPLEFAPAVALLSGVIALGGLISAVLLYLSREEPSSNGAR
jgi:hypothetical protein